MIQGRQHFVEGENKGGLRKTVSDIAARSIHTIRGDGRYIEVGEANGNVTIRFNEDIYPPQPATTLPAVITSRGSTINEYTFAEIDPHTHALITNGKTGTCYELNGILRIPVGERIDLCYGHDKDGNGVYYWYHGVREDATSDVSRDFYSATRDATWDIQNQADGLYGVRYTDLIDATWDSTQYKIVGRENVIDANGNLILLRGLKTIRTLDISSVVTNIYWDSTVGRLVVTKAKAIIFTQDATTYIDATDCTVSA